MSVCDDAALIVWTASGRNDHGTPCDHLITAPTPLVFIREWRRALDLGWTLTAINATYRGSTLRSWPLTRTQAFPNIADAYLVEVGAVTHRAGDRNAVLPMLRACLADLCPGWDIAPNGALLMPTHVELGAF